MCLRKHTYAPPTHTHRHLHNEWVCTNEWANTCTHRDLPGSCDSTQTSGYHPLPWEQTRRFRCKKGNKIFQKQTIVLLCRCSRGTVLYQNWWANAKQSHWTMWHIYVNQYTAVKPIVSWSLRSIRMTSDPHLFMSAEGFQSWESGKQNRGMTFMRSSASRDIRDNFSNCTHIYSVI